MNEHPDHQPTTVLIGSPHNEDFELLCEILYPLSVDDHSSGEQWSFEPHDATWFLSETSQLILRNAIEAYLDHVGFGPDESGDSFSFPDPYQSLPPRDSAHNPIPQTSDQTKSTLSPAECDTISRAQKLFEDLCNEMENPEAASSWIYDDVVPVAQVGQDDCIIGGSVIWSQTFKTISSSTIVETVSKLRAHTENLPLQRPLKSSQSYYPLGMHELEMLWNVLMTGPQCAEVRKAREIVQATAVAAGVVYIVDLTPTVEVAVWLHALDSMVDIEAPTLHGGWVQTGQLSTLTTMSSWTQGLSQNDFSLPLTPGPDNQPQGQVFSAKDGRFLEASHSLSRTRTMAVKYRNSHELRSLLRIAAATWAAP